MTLYGGQAASSHSSPQLLQTFIVWSAREKIIYNVFGILTVLYLADIMAYYETYYPDHKWAAFEIYKDKNSTEDQTESVELMTV